MRMPRRFKYLNVSINSSSLWQCVVKWAFVHRAQICPTSQSGDNFTSSIIVTNFNFQIFVSPDVVQRHPTFWGSLPGSALKYAWNDNSDVCRIPYVPRHCHKHNSIPLEGLEAGTEIPTIETREEKLKQGHWLVQLEHGHIGLKPVFSQQIYFFLNKIFFKCRKNCNSKFS